jgi:hypothetical protein
MIDLGTFIWRGVEKDMEEMAVYGARRCADIDCAWAKSWQV